MHANLCCRGIGEHALQNCDMINRYQKWLAEADGLGISIPRCLDEVLFVDEDFFRSEFVRKQCSIGGVPIAMEAFAQQPLQMHANLCCRGIGEHALQDCSEEYCCKVLGLSLQYLLDAGTSAVTVPWLGYVSSGKFSQKKDCKGVRMNQNAVYLTPVLPASTEAQRSCAPPVSQAALAAATQPGHQPWVANDGEAVPTELMWCVPTVPLWPAIPPGVEGGFQDTPFATHAGDRINRCFDILDSCMSVATGACAARVAQLCLPGYQERLAESDGLGISIPRCLDEVLFLDEDAHSI
ncbi:unnamed protein product [Symbiodinium microadriaticum]|nr:unnamed protein product [Symbiodinium microadriaticum]